MNLEWADWSIHETTCRKIEYLYHNVSSYHHLAHHKKSEHMTVVLASFSYYIMVNDLSRILTSDKRPTQNVFAEVLNKQPG